MTQKERYSRLEQYGYGPNVMKKIKICDKCGQIMQSDMERCSACREALSGETLYDYYKKQHMCCPRCDAVLSSDSIYCPACGSRLAMIAVEDVPHGS